MPERLIPGGKEVLFCAGDLRTKSLKILDYLIGGSLCRVLRPRIDAKKDIKPGSIKKLLLIRPGGIGDAIFLLPILNALRKSRPGLLIDILCEKRNNEVFSSQPGLVDKIYYYHSPKSWLSVFRQRYDLAIDTEQFHYFSALFSYFLGSYSIGFATRPSRQKFFNQKIDYEINGYELENFKQLFAGFFPEVKNPEDINSCFTVPEEILKWASSRIKAGSVSVSLGGSIPARRLTLEQAAEIINLLLSRGLRVVLLGGSNVAKFGERLMQKISDERVVNFIGRTSLVQSAAILKKSRFFIGPDSGLMHLACAVGVPVIAFFGPGNQQKWGARGSRHVIISSDAGCSPCTLFGYTPQCHNVICMKSISAKDVILAIRNLEGDKSP